MGHLQVVEVRGLMMHKYSVMERMIVDFLERWPNAENGPAHIVLGDNNDDVDSIEWCLKYWEEPFDQWTPVDAEVEATEEFLLALLVVARMPEW